MPGRGIRTYEWSREEREMREKMERRSGLTTARLGVVAARWSNHLKVQSDRS